MIEKLQILDEINKKIIDIQNKYFIKIYLDGGLSFDFDIPNDEFKWIENNNLGEGTLYKKIKLENVEDDSLNNILLFYGKKGGNIKNHNHEESQLIICVEGYVKFIVDDTEYNIRKGESLNINSYQWHSIDFIEASKLIIIYKSK